ADHAAVPSLDVRLRALRERRATDVERAHRELRARLADRLRRDHADRFAEVHLAPAREVASVALDAHAALGRAGQHGADLHLLNARVLDQLHLLLVDLFARLAQNFFRVRVRDVFERDAAEDAV